jgi:hypothetical protein
MPAAPANWQSWCCTPKSDPGRPGGRPDRPVARRPIAGEAAEGSAEGCTKENLRVCGHLEIAVWSQPNPERRELPAPIGIPAPPVPATGKAPGRKATPLGNKLLLVLGLAFVLGSRLLLYWLMPDRTSDFDALYDTAIRLVHGQNPYPPGMQWFPYPLPAVLLAVPFTPLPVDIARPVFDVLIGWTFAYALWKRRGPFALLAIVSGPYLFAMVSGQTTPLMVAASLIPALGFLQVLRPNTSAPLWIARPTWMALLGAIGILVLSIVILPTWPRDWWLALPVDTAQLVPPIMRPLGFILLLAAIRWRTPEGRLILATAFAPQSTLLYELVPMSLVPGNRLEMLVYVAASWIPLLVADRLLIAPGSAEWGTIGWQVTLFAGYVPMLALVLRRRPGDKQLPKFWLERRRPNRLPDAELRVEVSPNPGGGITVRVTHLPTQLYVEETGTNRRQTTRKAHDRLAALFAETTRLSRGESSTPDWSSQGNGKDPTAVKDKFSELRWLDE